MKTSEKGFTLIELLVVVAIMAIIMGLAIPAFQGTGRGGKVRSALFQINSHFNLARQMAITTRQNVYVIFPDNAMTYNSNNISLAYSSYGIYGERDGYIGEWRRLPPGVVFQDVYDPTGDASPQKRNLFLQDPTIFTVNVPFPNAIYPKQDVMAFTFRPDGHVDHAGFYRKSIYLTEGWVEYDAAYNSASIIPKFRANTAIVGLEIQPVTGQAKAREY